MKYLDMVEYENVCLDIYVFKKNNNICFRKVMVLEIKKER